MNEVDTDRSLKTVTVYTSLDNRRRAIVYIAKSIVPGMLTDKYYAHLNYSINSHCPETDIEGLKVCHSLDEAKALAESFIA